MTDVFCVPTARNARPEHAVFRVEQQRAELLDVAPAEPRQQIRGGVPRPSNRDAFAGRRRKRAAAQLERRNDPRRARSADSGGPHQLIAAGTRQVMQPAVRRQELARNSQGARAPRSGADDQRHELVVAQGRRAMTLELLSRTIARS